MGTFRLVESYMELNYKFNIYEKIKGEKVEGRFIILNLLNQNFLVRDGKSLLDAAYEKFDIERVKNNWEKINTYMIFLVDGGVNGNRILEKENDQLFFKKYVIENYKAKLEIKKDLEEVLKEFIPCLAPIEELTGKGEKKVIDILDDVEKKLKLKEYKSLNEVINGDLSKLKDLKIENIFNGENDYEIEINRV